MTLQVEEAIWIRTRDYGRLLGKWVKESKNLPIKWSLQVPEFQCHNNSNNNNDGGDDNDCGTVLSISERFRNSTFLQKGQRCQLKTAEKLRFCIHFSQNKMQNCYPLCLCLSFKLKVKKRYLFLKKKSCIFSFRVDDILTSILSALHPFLTFPNDLLKHKRGIFFRFQAIS